MKIEGVIPAIRNMKDFERIIESDHQIMVMLETRISQLPQLVRHAKKHHKKVLVHADLINGLKVDAYGMEFLVRLVKVDGVISTRTSVIALAKKYNILAIQRCFAIDSSAIANNIKLIEKSQPDYIEVLPGIMPTVISEFIDRTKVPVIAGGLIKNKDQVNQALQVGAVAITTSHKQLL
ncbi:glycerol-3-phosphate responsive antiterminator [Paraliobacillus salinarum]|uniref:glycerol-3-phosphate responsive antiterminator n=1 Tax=Paraliobacillus salinarum TaxID=1158996 RepID=UPI0015F3C1DB|nr:glycerol-3-phosphate responsive antiterminator [Paraliobacillus salinarum]